MNKYLISLTCKNPNCNNIFQIRKYDIGKKFYCCRKCRSNHHWLITPLFEKKCLNSSCNNIIKRKFKQQIDKINYCSLICRKIHKEQIFKESLKDTIKSKCRVCNMELVTYREPCGKLIPRKICDECDKKEKQQRALQGAKRFKFLYKNNKEFNNKIKNIHIENKEKTKKWFQNKENYKMWSLKMRDLFLNQTSKIEYKTKEYLNKKFPDFKIKHQEPISNILVDFYIPDKKLVIECHGDYWHMNPSKYKIDDINHSTKRTAKEQWEKDKNRRIFLESNGYKVIELWESEINRGDYKKLDIYT